jgi:hypothetical protein
VLLDTLFSRAAVHFENVSHVACDEQHVRALANEMTKPLDRVKSERKSPVLFINIPGVAVPPSKKKPAASAAAASTSGATARAVPWRIDSRRNHGRTRLRRRR